MQFTFSEQNTLNNFCFELFDKQTADYYKAKDSIGIGEAYFKEYDSGLKIIYLDMTLNNLALFKWNYQESYEPSVFFLFNPMNTKTAEFAIGKTAERGYTIFNQTNTRRRIWLPNERYCVFVLEVKHTYIETLNNLLGTKVTTFANYKPINNLYFQSKLDSNNKIILTQTINAITDKTEQNDILLQIKCAELIHQTLTNASAITKGTIKSKSLLHKQRTQLDNFINQLEESPDSIPTITEASSILGMSRSKFQQLFKTITGATYHSFVIKLKMEYSIELLTTNYSVGETAHLCGYSTIGNFTAAFKRYYNFLPSDVVGQFVQSLQVHRNN